AALHRADAVSAAHSVADEMAARRVTRPVGAAVRADLAIRLVPDGLSRRLLDIQPVRMAAAVRVRRVVRAGRRRADVADPVVAGDDVDLHRLSGVCILRHADLAHPATQLPDAEAARTVDVPDHQDRSGRVAICPFSGPGGAHRALPAQELAWPAIALAATIDPVWPAF